MYKFEFNNGFYIEEDWDIYNYKEKFVTWWDRFKEHDISGYEYILCGGFLNKESCKDIDIVMLGPKDQKIKQIQDIAQKIAFDLKIWIDIFWQDKLYNFVEFEPIKRIRNYNQQTKTIVYNDGTSYIRIRGYGGKKILKGLYEFDRDKPNRYYQNGKKYKINHIKIEDYINGTNN